MPSIEVFHETQQVLGTTWYYLVLNECDEAAIRGDLHGLKEAYTRGVPLRRAAYYAARKGDLQCLQFAHENGDASMMQWICEAAAEGGNIECVKYAHDSGFPMMSENICMHAASGGNIDCLVYVHENGAPMTDDVIKSAASYGHIECAEYAHANGARLKDDAVLAAIVNGHVNFLEFAHTNGFAFACLMCRVAASRRQVGCLKFMHEIGVKFSVGVAIQAAFTGDLGLLKYVHEIGAPIDEDVCHAAAKNGHLDSFVYACENTLYFDEKYASKLAECNGHVHILVYMYIHHMKLTYESKRIIQRLIDAHKTRAASVIQRIWKCHHMRRRNGAATAIQQKWKSLAYMPSGCMYNRTMQHFNTLSECAFGKARKTRYALHFGARSYKP